jgi:pimeloyl-ACP methyl ester carboxylesterase
MLIDKSFSANAVSLNYVEGPAGGPALLLLHGLTQRWQAFLSLVPQLTQTHHVFAPDLRGHGKSDRVSGGYRGEDYAKDVMEFMEHVIGEPAAIFGHSLGGMIGVYVAACRPELVRALIIGDSKLFMNDLNGSMYGEMFVKTLALLRCTQKFEELRRGVSEMSLHSPVYGEVAMGQLPECDQPYLSSWARSLSQLDPETLEMALDGRASQNWRPDDFLRKVKCPTLLIQADPKMGGLMTTDGVAQARGLLAESQHICLDGLGHSLQMSDPEPVRRAVTNFLSALC